MSKRGDILKELHEVELDLVAVRESRDVIQRRIALMDGTPRRDVFVSWAVMQILLNSFIVASVRCEGLIEDFKKVLQDMEANNVVQLARSKDDVNG